MSKMRIADMLVRREIEDTDLMIVEDKIDTKQATVVVGVLTNLWSLIISYHICDCQELNSTIYCGFVLIILLSKIC